MCNAVNKYVAMALSAIVVMSCSKENPDKKAAEGLLTQIESQIEIGNYQQAMLLMDSVDRTYRDQIDIRKKVTALRPKAIEAVTLEQISSTDSIIAFAQAEIDRLSPLMKHIADEDLKEGKYVVADTYKANIMNTTTIEPRVNDYDYSFYIVANCYGKKIGISQISLSSAEGEFASEPIPSTSSRRMEVETSEIATFLPEEVADLGEWASNNYSKITGANIIGTKDNLKVKLTPQQASAFATAWNFSKENQKLKNVVALRIKLDRQLQVARDQIANTTVYPSEEIEK